MNYIFWAHIAGFGFAFIACLFACWRTRLLAHTGTRYGLYGLFITSGLWAGAYLVTFFTSSLPLATAAYQLGLICGISTVFAWLYFCSAYTGESYHQQSVYQRAAIVVLISIVMVKLTNQFHGLYFSIEMVNTPFPHASVTLLEIHWIVTILAYALSAIGFYMLLQLFQYSDIETRGLTFLVGLTALPILLNIASIFTDSRLVATNYEPLGVAVFALGTLYVAQDTFERVRWTGHQQVFDDIDEAILLLDEDGHIYKYNSAAELLFPKLHEKYYFDTILSDMKNSERQPKEPSWSDGGELLCVEDGTRDQYFLMQENELTIGPHTVGQVVVISDVTRLERQRRELERQSAQMEGFSEAVAHELRNSLTIIDGNLQLLTNSFEENDILEQKELIQRVLNATNRMCTAVDGLTTISRLSQPVTDPELLSYQAVIREAFETASSRGLTLTVNGEGEILADRVRFIELLENAIQLAVATESSELTAHLTNDELLLQMDGDSLMKGDTESLFRYGTAVPHAEAGMFGPNLRSLAQTHGWDVTAHVPENGGIAIRISGVRIE